MAENNGIELAKAYIPIVPSMEGVQGKLEQVLDEEMGGAGDRAGKTFGSSLVDKAKTIVGAAALGKVIGDSFMEGAALEQSLGGVETMFKDNADTVIKNADRAYKTAGRSANDYLETVTGFSASLIQSLGGDTAAAAKYADMAVIDMSDNVNKFGGEIDSLTTAYAGFSKGQFQLLDNLKLGYGGTKEEMQRLLSDAEALAGKEFDISSYADIIEAIHVIQTDLDVTGTTAKEASSTFSGSFASMKAAAQSLLGDITTGRDTQQAIDGLAESTGDFAGNVVRMSENMISSLDQLDEKLTEGVAESLGIDRAALEGLIKTVEIGAGAFIAYKAAMDIESAGKAVVDSVKNITAAMAENGSAMAALNINPYALATAGAVALGIALKSVIDYQTELIDEITDRYDGLTAEQIEFLNLSDSVLAKVGENVSARQKSAEQLEEEAQKAENLAARLYELDSADKVTAAGQEEMKAIVEELKATYPELSIAIDKGTGHLRGQRNELDRLVQAAKQEAAAEQARAKIADIDNDLANAKAVLTEAEEKYKAAKESKADIKERVDSLAKEMETLREHGLQTDEQSAKYDELKLKLQDLKNEQADAANAVGETGAAFSAASTAVARLSDEYDNATAALESMQSTAEDGYAVINGQRMSFEEAGQTARETAARFKDYVATVGGETYNISQNTYDKINELSEKYLEAVQSQEQNIRGSLDLFGEWSGGAETSADELINNLDANQQGLESWAENLRTLAEWGIDEGLLNTLEEAGPASASKVQAMVDMGEPKMKAYSDQWATLQGEIHTIAEQQSSDVLEQTGEMMSKLIGVVDDGKADTKDKYRELADEVVAGYANGIRDGTDNVIVPVTAEMVNKAIQAAKKEAGIESPSKVYRRLGLYNDEGFALGMADGEDMVAAASQSMVRLAVSAANLEAEKSRGSLESIVRLDIPKRDSGLLKLEPDSGDSLVLKGKGDDSLFRPVMPDTSREETTKIYSRESGSKDKRTNEFTLVLPDRAATVLARWIVPLVDLELGQSVTINARGGAV